MNKKIHQWILSGMSLLSAGALTACGSGSPASEVACPAGSVSVFSSGTGAEVGLKTSTLSGARLAQTFTPTTDLGVTAIQLKLKRKGDPNGDLTIGIYADNSGTPSTTITGSALVWNVQSSLLEHNLSDTGEWIKFSYGSTVGLTANTKYWLILSTNYNASNSDIVQWMAVDGDTYTGGAAFHETGSATGIWAQTAFTSARDYNFIMGCE